MRKATTVAASPATRTATSYKTTDFKGTSHYYAYDSLSRMAGHGADIDADDETYTWACGSKLTAYSDALGTARLSYDGLNRLTSFADSNGNSVLYEYDTQGRITKLTPVHLEPLRR